MTKLLRSAYGSGQIAKHFAISTDSMLRWETQADPGAARADSSGRMELAQLRRDVRRRMEREMWRMLRPD